MARRSDHSREELQLMALDAAEKLLDEQGGAALSTRKVASAIGYSAGALYLVFKNLDDLCWQVNARTLQGLQTALDQGAEQLSARDRLKTYARVYLDYAQQWPHRWSLLFEHNAVDNTDAPEWLQQSIENLFNRIEQALKLLYPQETEAEITLAARTLWSGVHGITLLKLRDKLFLGGQMVPQLMSDSLVDRYLDGWHSKQGEL
ncbi:MAG: TetR/AcrR family transcriptional regulator [Pontibacterium sp.]